MFLKYTIEYYQIFLILIKSNVGIQLGLRKITTKGTSVFCSIRMDRLVHNRIEYGIGDQDNYVHVLEDKVYS